MIAPTICDCEQVLIPPFANVLNCDGLTDHSETACVPCSAGGLA